MLRGQGRLAGSLEILGQGRVRWPMMRVFVLRGYKVRSLCRNHCEFQMLDAKRDAEDGSVPQSPGLRTHRARCRQ